MANEYEGFDQIVNGIVPDAVQTYNPQKDEKTNYAAGFDQVIKTGQRPSVTSFDEPKAEKESDWFEGGQDTESSIEPPKAAPPAKGALDWLQPAIQGAGKAIGAIPGNIQHGLQNEGFRDARRAIYGAGLPGEIAKDVGQFGMSAEKAGKGVLTHPRASIQPAIAGAASGATALVENPIALATNLAGGNYNQMVGGKPVQQRVLEGIGQGTEKKFPDIANVGGQAGNLAAGFLGGAALAPAAEALLVQRAAPLFNSLLMKAGIKPAVQVLDRIAAQNPSLAYKIARGAAVGGSLNAGLEAGGHAAYGQPMQVSAKGTAEGALLGAAGGAFAKEAPRTSETVHGEVLPSEGETPPQIGYGALSKKRRIADLKQEQAQEEPITNTPQMPQPPTVKALPPPPNRAPEALYPWQKSYTPMGMQPGGMAPDRYRWNQTVQDAQQPQSPEQPRQVGQIVKPKEVPAEQPPAQAAPPPTQTEPTQPKAISEIKPAKAAKPFPWENPNLTPAQQFGVAAQIYSETKSDKTAAAAEAFIKQERQKAMEQPQAKQEQPQLGEPEKTPEPQLKGQVEETAPKEEAPKSRAQAMYEEAGVVPPREEMEGNPFEARKEVPVGELRERHPETGRFTEPFNTVNPEPRDVKWSETGRIHGAVPHPAEGKAIVGGVIDRPTGGSKGAGRRSKVFGTLFKKTSMGHQLGTEEKFTEEQEHANVRGQKENKEGNTPLEQGQAIEAAARRNKKIIEAADKGSPDAVAEAAAKTAPKEKEVATPLAGDPLINAEALKSLAKDLLGEEGSGITEAPLKTVGAILKSPKTIWNSRFMNEMVKPILSAQTSMDELRKGAQALNDPLATKIWRNFGGEFIRGFGMKMTGEFGKEARKAMYKESVDEILDPANHPGWTEGQRRAIAWKKYYRLKSRELINDFRKDHDGKIPPRLDRVLSDIHRGLISPGERNYSGMNAYDMWVEGLGHAAYHSIFFLNPKTHLQILTHPLQTGTAVVTKGINPASGPINIGNAYRLMASNKTFQEFMKGSTAFTGDVRFEATKDFMDKTPYPKISTPLSKIVERDFATGRINNEVIGAAGLLKEYGQAKTEQLMHDINTGADWTKSSGLTFDERADMIGTFLQTIHDATGSGTAGVARTLLQSTNSGLGRAVFQLSGYTQQVARFYADQTTKMFTGKSFAERAEAATKLGVMISATTLMGGNAIPKAAKDQFDVALIKGSPETYLALRKAQDLLNLPKQIPHAFSSVTGLPDTLSTDMGEHLSNSFINWAGNIGVEGLGGGAKAGAQLAGQTFGVIPPSKNDTPEMLLRKFVAGAMMGIFVEGVGGQSVSNLWKAGEMIGTGKKITTLYGANPLKRAGEYPIARGQQKYVDLLDSISHAVHDVLIPGRGYDESNWAIQQEIADKFKRAGKPVPWEQLKVDYPTTITKAPSR